jgi:hypothetical protein
MNRIIAFFIVITSIWITLRGTIAATDDPKKVFRNAGAIYCRSDRAGADIFAVRMYFFAGNLNLCRMDVR